MTCFRIVDDGPTGVIGDASDIHDSMGSVKLLVDLTTFPAGERFPFAVEQFVGARTVPLVDGVKCGVCGYDRGVYHAHTEHDVHTVHCRNCETTLFQMGE
jgi:hypothetical protein